MLVLVHAIDLKPAEIGETVMDFNGESWILVGSEVPYKPSSTGRIHVRRPEGDRMTERSFFPSVCGLKWVDENQIPEQEYKVEITETLQKTVTVKAKNRGEAITKVKEMYRNEEVVLEYDSYIDTEFEIREEN